MDFVNFSQAIKGVFRDTILPEEAKYFISQLDHLATGDVEDSLKMTRASILFEGYYRHLKDSHLKKMMSQVKTKRWEHHFGTPTVPFLLSYKTQIDQTTKFFNEFSKSDASKSVLPWLICNSDDDVIDKINHVIANPEIMNRVETPKNREQTGVFTKTHNPFGGFTTSPCDPVSQKFIQDASMSALQGGRVLEIGAAFGAATLEAIAKGATVFCNDIDPENLAVVHNRFLEITKDKTTSLSGDNNKLVLIPGELPHELIGLPEKSFDAILICRVLHFFTGDKIEESLALMAKLLTPGGKIYIVCETPFLKNWQRFIPEFNRRIAKCIEWPGEITNPADFESSGRAASLPKFVHWITKEVLERSLERAGFEIEHSAYINRVGQFPEDLLLPEYGQESVGAIGVVRSKL